MEELRRRRPRELLPEIIPFTAYTRETEGRGLEIVYVEAVGLNITEPGHPYEHMDVIRHRVIYTAADREGELSPERYRTRKSFMAWMRRYGAKIDLDWTHWAKERLAEDRAA